MWWGRGPYSEEYGHICGSCRKGTCHSKLSGSCCGKRRFQFGVWLCIALWWGICCGFGVFFSPSKHLQAAFCTLRCLESGSFMLYSYIQQSNSCLLLNANGDHHRKPLSHLLAATGLAEEEEECGQRSYYLAVFLQLQAGWEGVGMRSSFKDKQSRGFGSAARCFLRVLQVGAGWGDPSPLGVGQGPGVESILTGFPMLGSCALPQFPSPVPQW